MIWVNGEWWTIRVVLPTHPALNPPMGRALGCCDDIRKTIYLNSAIPPWRMKAVLCHEISHAVFYSYNVELNYQTEEIVAELIAHYGHEILTLTHNAYNEIKGMYR